MARRLNAWLTPDIGTGQTLSRCITMPIELLPYVTGALSALTEPWRWEQYGTMTPSEAAYLSSAMLAQFLNECEGANVLLRQNENQPCILERSDDNGETWVQFAALDLCEQAPPMPQTTTYDDLRVNPTTGEPEFSLDGGTTWTPIPEPTDAPPTNPWAPPRQAAPGATDGLKRCAAASAAANNLNTMYQQTYGAVAAGLLNSLSQVNEFLSKLNRQLASIVWGTYWDVIEAIGFYEEYESTQYTAPGLTGQQMQDLVCLLWSYATVDGNGVVSFDWNGVRGGIIGALGINPGTAVWTHLNYLGESGLNRIGEVGFGNQYDCEPCQEAQWVALGGDGHGGFEAIANPWSGNCIGTYNVVDDRFESCKVWVPNEWRVGVRIKKQFADVVVSSVTVKWQGQSFISGVGGMTLITRNNGGTVSSNRVGQTSGTYTRNFSPAVTIDEIEIVAEGYMFGTGSENTYYRITRVEAVGTGPAPF